MSVKEELYRLIEELPEEKIGLARDLLTRLRGNETQEERAARVRSVRGKYAHVPTSSEAYYRHKHEDRDHEEEQAARRARGEG